MVGGYQSDLAQRILNGGFVLPHDVQLQTTQDDQCLVSMIFFTLVSCLILVSRRTDRCSKRLIGQKFPGFKK